VDGAADHVAEVFELVEVAARRGSGLLLVRTDVVCVVDCRHWMSARRSTPLLLSVVLVCHSRGRSLDMISPALRICMETARARLALAGRPVRPEPEGVQGGVEIAVKVQIQVYRVWYTPVVS
jgi:hypothetical protein